MSFKKRLRDFAFLGNPLSNRNESWVSHLFKTEADTKAETAKIEARGDAKKSIMREYFRELRNMFWLERLSSGNKQVKVKSHMRRVRGKSAKH